MKKYIEANKLIENLKEFAPEHYSKLIEMLILKQPEVEPMEIVKNRLKDGIWLERDGYVLCVQCGRTSDKATEYCPNCGARNGARE